MERRARVIIIWGLSAGEICSKIMNGASFCQVDKISPVFRSSPCRTSGSQKCIGARPNFRARAIVTSVIAGMFSISKILH